MDFTNTQQTHPQEEQRDSVPERGCHQGRVFRSPMVTGVDRGTESRPSPDHLSALAFHTGCESPIGKQAKQKNNIPPSPGSHQDSDVLVQRGRALTQAQGLADRH